MIEDAAAVKPAGWMDDAAFEIPDPEALKPEDWDDEEVRSQTVCVRVCLFM
jgi:Calreticulin family